MYPYLLEKLVADLRREHKEVICFEGPSLSGEGLFYILCRPLTLNEFEYYAQVQARSYEDAKDFVCRIAVLDIFDAQKNRFVPLKELPLGIYDQTEEIILANSQFSPEGVKSLVNMHRQLSRQTHMQAIAFICGAFPSLRPQDIECMTANNMAKHISLAEILYQAKGQENAFFEIYTAEDKVDKKQIEATVLKDIGRQARENDKVMGIKR